MRQPFFLPKEWALGSNLLTGILEKSVSQETRLLERAFEINEKRADDVVTDVINQYNQWQQCWWQAPSEIEKVSLAKKKFQELATRWRKETKHLSSLTKVILHPAYQRIIGMGPIAIKFILQELAARPYHWFWALEAITGVNPVHPDDDFDQAVEAWLRWGRERKLI